MVRRRGGLLTTRWHTDLAAQRGYALEASVAITGALVQLLR